MVFSRLKWFPSMIDIYMTPILAILYQFLPISTLPYNLQILTFQWGYVSGVKWVKFHIYTGFSLKKIHKHRGTTGLKGKQLAIIYTKLMSRKNTFQLCMNTILWEISAIFSTNWSTVQSRFISSSYIAYLDTSVFMKTQVS